MVVVMVRDMVFFTVVECPFKGCVSCYAQNQYGQAAYRAHSGCSMKA